MRSLARRLLLPALLFVATAVQTAPLRNPIIIDLGALGASGAHVTAINNRGDVVGYSGARLLGTTSDVNRAFLWQNGVMQELGAPVSLYSQAMSVNDRGTIAINGDGNRAFLWKDSQWIDMQVFGTPYDINRFEAVTGIHRGNRGLHAFLWQDGVRRDLGTLGGSASIGMALNDKGTVVGGSYVAGDEAERAFVFKDGVMRDLGTLGGRNSHAVDINDHGVVVGWSDLGNGEATAFVWDGTTMRRLLAAPGNHWATAINNQGAIVGGSDWGSFVYQDGAAVRLEHFPNVRNAGWTRLHPVDINDLGWIVGYGYRKGMTGPRAFLVKPR
jgi:probable HAF family extracellular repeat protein